MYLPDSSILTNIQVQGHCRLREILFEKKYIVIRSLENRLCTDEELSKLPEISIEHPHYGEWEMRKRSAIRLIRYLSGRKRSLDILDVGCGNGWLTHHLAEIPGTRVTGVDINFTELQQAARVFSNDPNLRFIHGDIRSGILEDRQFDCIVYAASIEYFPSLKKIVHFCLSCLKPGGEIHILDTPLYRSEQIERARRQSQAYFASFGYPEMADYYYHHNIFDLRSFHHDLLHNPHSVRSRLMRTGNPNPWIRIKNI
ncbi:MAG TPA: class I SAM-dependent methyltransferase [Puia sp.]|jgi:SAM-dependent methyltransferase|nr:class I SAM-dependent methyltransferase [Puia sp.]